MIINPNSKNFTPLLTCYFDGACGPVNPGGHIGYGWAITENEVVIASGSGYVKESPSNTNNVAEYMALNDLLAFLIKEKITNKPLLIKGDSMMVVKQMNGYWSIKQGFYKQQAIQCWKLLENFDNVMIKWIGRDFNKLADELSKKEFTQRSIQSFDASNRPKHFRKPKKTFKQTRFI